MGWAGARLTFGRRHIFPRVKLGRVCDTKSLLIGSGPPLRLPFAPYLPGWACLLDSTDVIRQIRSVTRNKPGKTARHVTDHPTTLA